MVILDGKTLSSDEQDALIGHGPEKPCWIRVTGTLVLVGNDGFREAERRADGTYDVTWHVEIHAETIRILSTQDLVDIDVDE